VVCTLVVAFFRRFFSPSDETFAAKTAFVKNFFKKKFVAEVRAHASAGAVVRTGARED
jgi:hypothetical protein